MGFVSKVVKFFDVVSSRAAARELLTSPYFSMSSHKLLAGIHGYEPRVRAIIDVGASQGQFALAASYRYPGAPILLKMDVQGFEKEVLIGAEKTLAEVDWIVAEVAFSPLYKQQPLFSELHHYFEEHGFDLVAPLDFNLGARSRIIEMDVLYRRRGAA